MDVADIAFSAAFNVLSIYINIRVIKLFLQKKKKRKLPELMVYGLFWLENWLVYYLCHNWAVVTISFIAGAVFVVEMVFEGSIWKKMTAVVFAWGESMLVEEMVWHILQNKQELEHIEAVGSMWSALYSLIVVSLLDKFFQVSKDTTFSKTSYWNLLIVSGGSAVTGGIISEHLGKDRRKTGILLYYKIQKERKSDKGKTSNQA